MRLRSGVMGIFGALGLLFMANQAVWSAGTFPSKPITIVVHAGAGGGSDIFARTLASAFEKEKLLPQPIVVENKPGGSGAIAFAYVAGKKGDPHFLLTAVTSFLTTPLRGGIPVSYKDFTPIANFAFDEYMVIVKNGSRFDSMKAVIDADTSNSLKAPVRLHPGVRGAKPLDRIVDGLVRVNLDVKPKV